MRQALRFLAPPVPNFTDDVPGTGGSVGADWEALRG